MLYSPIKRSHPADKNNTDAKNIMSTHEEKLPKIPQNIKNLREELGIPENCCTYCGKVPSDGKLSFDEIVPCKDGGRYFQIKEKNPTVKELKDMAKKRNIRNRTKLTTKEQLLKALDIDIKKKIPLNITGACKICNNSKNDLKDDELRSWIRNGPKNGNGSYVPRENQERMIKWYSDNRSYIRTDDKNILHHIKQLQEKNKKHWEETEQETKKIVI
jgi:hypothetical protein